MKKLVLSLIILFVFISLNSDALNVTIIESESYNSGQIMDQQWQNICTAMGYTAAIYQYTELDSLSNLSATDILIVSSALDASLTAARISVIRQYLQNGGKVYIQSEYLATYPGNIAYQSLVDSLGGYFNWTGVVSGTLEPMNILGSLATDYAVTSPLLYFWYGQSIDPCSTVEMFLEYESNYFGSIFCVPSSSGRMITSSDQDWVNQYTSYPASDSLMKNIISNLAKTSYSCSNSGTIISVNLGNDTTICNENSIVLRPGKGYSSYLWKGGQTTDTLSVNAAGSYWVKVTSPCGSSASDTINIAVEPCNPPVAALLSSDSSFCANDCIGYTDLSTNNPTSWLWTFQGGLPSSSAARNPQNICYPNAGNFNVTLIVANSNGSDTLTFNDFISVLVAPQPPVITQSNDTLYCSVDTSYSAYQWSNGSTVIPNATDDFLVINQGGNYNVQVTNRNGCSIAVGINITTGVNDFTSVRSIYLYPDPASDQLTINGSSILRNSIINVFNMLGQVVQEERAEFSTSSSSNEEQHITISTRNLPAGFYFIQVTNQSAKWIGQFVKE